MSPFRVGTNLKLVDHESKKKKQKKKRGNASSKRYFRNDTFDSGTELFRNFLPLLSLLPSTKRQIISQVILKSDDDHKNPQWIESSCAARIDPTLAKPRVYLLAPFGWKAFDFFCGGVGGVDL